MKRILILLALTACAAPSEPAKQATAETAYTAEITKCATEAPTRAAGEACIADVQKRWAVKP